MGVKDYVQSEFDSVEAEIISANKDLKKLALVPFADLVNHSPDITSEGSCWEIKGKGLFGREAMFTLRTPVDVKSGEQFLSLIMG